jgi:hypothetical protein
VKRVDVNALGGADLVTVNDLSGTDVIALNVDLAGTLSGAARPVRVNDLPPVSAIAAGELRTCALTRNGGVKCWGLNFDGELGDGTTRNRKRPISAVDLSAGVSAIATGGYEADTGVISDYTCALTTQGEVKCWGASFELGNGARESGYGKAQPTPVPVIGFGPKRR